jgi:hypothetical protein
MSDQGEHADASQQGEGSCDRQLPAAEAREIALFLFL